MFIWSFSIGKCFNYSQRQISLWTEHIDNQSNIKIGLFYTNIQLK